MTTDQRRPSSLPPEVPHGIVVKAHRALHTQWSKVVPPDGTGCGDCLDDVGVIFEAVWDDLRDLAEKGSSPTPENVNRT